LEFRIEVTPPGAGRGAALVIPQVEGGVRPWPSAEDAHLVGRCTQAAARDRAADAGAGKGSPPLQVIATIDDPAVIHRILVHLALPGARDSPEHAVALSPLREEQPALPCALPS